MSRLRQALRGYNDAPDWFLTKPERLSIQGLETLDKSVHDAKFQSLAYTSIAYRGPTQYLGQFRL